MTKLRKLFSLCAAFLCAAMLMCACGKKEEKTIVLGYDNTAEEAILASMLVSLIEQNTDIKVTEMGDLSGGETVMFPAIKTGEIDMYPEYTGTAWLTILKRTDIPPREELNAELFKVFKNEYNLDWTGLYGFSNAYGIAVSNQAAEKYGIETYSDLAEVSPELIFGSEPDFFEREDGYSGLCKTYGFEFKESVEMNWAAKYDAVTQKKVDAINIFTTDGRLAVSDVKVLEDDLHYFPEYLCGTVIRADTLEKYPELREVLLLMEGLISNEDMSMLNKLVEVDGLDAKEVGINFLVERGLLKK